MTSATTNADPGYGIAAPGYRLPAGDAVGSCPVAGGRPGPLARVVPPGARPGGGGPNQRASRPGPAGHGSHPGRAARAPRGYARPPPWPPRPVPLRPAAARPRLRWAASFATSREINERAGMSDHLVSEALYLSDPDGLGIEIYADRPRAAWRHQDRQLVMATNPLDVESVLAAGGGEPWSRDAGRHGARPRSPLRGRPRPGRAVLPRRTRTRPGGLELSRCPVPLGRRVSPPPGHQHLGRRARALAGENDARLLEWEIVLPETGDVRAAAPGVWSRREHRWSRTAVRRPRRTRGGHGSA